MLTAKEIRKRYLDFYQKKLHKIVESGPLVPPEDPTLLFTNAGMVQFKNLFTGEEKRDYTRAASCQKCLRVSGKHNDLENVGRTARHHTFFEMLGNFSFGDYFKEEAIKWAWEFVTEELKLPPEKLWVTIYKDDEEAAKIWEKTVGLPPERIIRMGEKDNFWTMGDTGPCGPCSEIYIDQGEEMSCGDHCGIGQCDCDRFLEIWNLVFTQFDQAKDGSRELLSSPNIDTGMGLERIAAVCQGKKSNFDCDLFRSIIDHAASLANVKYSESAPDTNEIDTALRVIADHARAASFMIAEGILPSNENRGYVLRRLIRRALRFATLMGIHEPFLHKVTRKVVEIMGESYPELEKNAGLIERAVFEEEKRFALTLDNGLHLLDEEILDLKKKGANTIPGDFCFKLYDTYGFPIDIVRDIAEKNGLEVDLAGFEQAMAEQKTRARDNQKKSGLLGQGKDSRLKEICKDLQKEGIDTRFVGYETLETLTRTLALINGEGKRISALGEGEKGYLVAAETPCYGESGGQVGDIGAILSKTGKGRVITTLKPLPNFIIQQIEINSGEIHTDEDIELKVDYDRRMNVARNHTCTHLLHAALRRVLGDHVRQAGSLVDGEKLRFDFSHFSALSSEELAAVERQVNRAIMADLPVNACEMPRDEAIAAGAMALFGEKYGDIVRVLSIGEETSESVELCGGTHLKRTGQAGAFLIVSESAVAAGTRRIEAVTGWNAYNLVLNQRAQLSETAMMLQAPVDQMAAKAWQMREEIKKLRKRMEKGSSAELSADAMEAATLTIGNLKVITLKLDDMPVKAMRELMDQLRGKYTENAIICLVGDQEGKLNMLLHVSKNIHDRITAPQLVKQIAPIIGGSGGGRPDLAQAGGTKPEKVEEAFNALKTILGK